METAGRSLQSPAERKTTPNGVFGTVPLAWRHSTWQRPWSSTRQNEEWQVFCGPTPQALVPLEPRSDGRLEGVVAEWNDRGYGFIVFTDGRRAYVHHTSVNSSESGPIDLKQGEKVHAIVVEDVQNAGKWAALDVHRKTLPVPPPCACAPAPSLLPLKVHAPSLLAPPTATGLLAPAPPGEGAERMAGVVREWNPRGFGFVLFPDGRRAYVHHSFIGGGNLQEGEAVVATIVEDAKNPGKWAATNVQRRPTASAPGPLQPGPVRGTGQPLLQTTLEVNVQAHSPSAARSHTPVQAQTKTQAHFQTRADERLEGVVTEWSERGYGFLQLSDGRRAYVHVSAFGTGNLEPGEMVNVAVIEDPQSPGKWQAQALQRGPLGEDAVVVEWRHEGGYGFVAMEDGRRVYIHHSVFGGGDLQVGMRLRVLTQPDQRNPGKWSVAAVKTDHPGPDNFVEETPNFQRPCAAVVVEWDLRGYGFVQADDGRRVYVHHTSFGSGNLALGERVSVVIIPDQRNTGKFMAQTLARDGGLVAQGCHLAAVQDVLGNTSVSPVASEPTSATHEEEWLGGVVREWHDERGYGFIELTDGRRLYVHHSAFGGAAANDPRVVYRYFDDSAHPWSIGAKRNVACWLAAGSVIVHFDDDDLYAPGYLSLMVRTLQLGTEGGCPCAGVEARLASEEPSDVTPNDVSSAQGQVSPTTEAMGPLSMATAFHTNPSLSAMSPGVSLTRILTLPPAENPNPPLRSKDGGFLAEAITFSSWHTFDVACGDFGICDVDNDHEGRQTWTLGYGFSFAYLREVWSAHFFRDVNLGEDCDFFEALLARGSRIVLLRDNVGFCAHTHHDANFSQWEKVRAVSTENVSKELREMATRLGSRLKVAKERLRPAATLEKARDIVLTPRTAASMQDELIAEYTKEHFQMKLHQSWQRNQDNVAMRLKERNLICLEVQGPIIERYGFPNSMEGVLLSTQAFTADLNDTPEMSGKNFLIHWLCKPELQASTPIDHETLQSMVANLTKSAKIRRRR